MNRVNYQLITLAREIEGRTQKEFAELLGVEQGTISKIENGFLEKTAIELVDKIAFVLDYPVDFFYQNWQPVRVDGHYRRRVSEPGKLYKECKAIMTLAAKHFDILTEKVELPKVNCPSWNLEEDGSIYDCIQYVKRYWRIPNGRINNITDILEDNGFVIIELDLHEMDGFSCYSESGVPLIFVNKNLSGDRYRMTVVHEAFHFILHHKQTLNSERKIEEEAKEIAGEFLVPSDELSKQITNLSLPRLADLKLYWKVSMQAILVRAKKCELVTKNQYDYLWKQLSIAGYRKKEPVDIPKEQPRIFREILDTMIEEYHYTSDEFRKLLNFNKVDEWYFNKPKSLKRVRFI